MTDRPHPRPDWTFQLVDTLEKVFADERPAPMAAGAPLSGFLGETLSVQLAYLPPAAESLSALGTLHPRVDGPLAHLVQVSTVELVPCALVAFDGHDDGYLRDSPGLYPDLLRPVPSGTPVRPAVGYWQALWFDVEVSDPALAGRHDLRLSVADADGATLFTATIEVVVHPVELPALDIVNTHWLHADSLAEYYDVPVFSEEHWDLLDAYLGAAARMRVNSVLTPTWTPPLDTAVGSERMPVQLIGITPDGGGHVFDFDLLGRWLGLCRKHGITTVEIAHLFTQWGATATPAIYVRTPAGVERRFGWDVPATDPAYRALLAELLPALRAYLAEHWDGGVLFHISDEPGEHMLVDYRAARAVVEDLLAGATVVDALSDFEFARSGTVDTPIVATNHVQEFLDHGMSPWVYYCVSQHRDVANRFIGLPSLRNRVLGRQLFVAGAPGFLHWGFNFWAAQYSTRPIDPFTDTSAGGAFPAGDPFIVYPGPDGQPWPSIRYRVFAQAMDDHRALQLLRDLTDAATARATVDQAGELGYATFSYDREHYLASRREVDAAIMTELARRDGSPAPGTPTATSRPGAGTAD
ncbi:DUF4091 domain-containing protein [Occultella kanbiaonis]|uniref:DUF4091 domain-containing protein n=1 Tax=Occultella kanbiaonis TaxID=2675754 RepID=UPI001F4863E0|nr:DUF4091 domain-containing protein [Occultella kanbiaonis]